MFLVHLIICLFVSQMTEKLLDQFSENLVEGCGKGQGLTH